jgi:DNA-binding phage protein
MAKKLQRLFRTGKLTAEEIANDETVRRQVKNEFPPASSTISTGPGSLSETLKQAIHASGKSVYQIASDSGVSQIVVSRFLSGERDIRMATADKLVHALGLKLETQR